jgi:hypothetical protein
MAAKGRGLTRALAIVGAVLVWLPLAAMALTGLIHSLAVATGLASGRTPPQGSGSAW